MRSTFKTFACACALACSGAASADPATIYGTLDAGARWANRAPQYWATSTFPAGGSRVSIVSGGLMSSVLGLKGSENLGSGWKALYQLEAGVNLDTGQTDGNVLFNRLSHVGLSNGRHSFYLGREYTTTYRSLSEFDPLGFRATPQNPNVVIGALYDTATFGSNLPGQSNIRSNSAARYDANFGAFKGGLQYAFGEDSRDFSSKSAYGAHASAKFGQASFGGGLARMNGAANDHVDVSNVGAKYALSPTLSISATGVWQDAQGGPLDGFSRRVASVGAYYAPGPMSYGLAYYDTRSTALGGRQGRNGDQDKIIGLLAYNFTKRTNVYAIVDATRDEGSLVPEGSVRIYGLGLGMSHMF